MTNEEIDMAEAALLDLVKIGSVVNPQMGRAAPFISMFIKFEARKIKSGLADGTIIPDGQGGLVPVSNSRYDPRTGAFT